MSKMPDIRHMVDDVFADYIVGPNGPSRYFDVADCLRRMNDNLIDHLDTLVSFGIRLDRMSEEQIIALNYMVDTDFEQQSDIRTGDMVVVRGSDPLIEASLEDMVYGPVRLTGPLHAVLGKTTVMEVPVPEAIPEDIKDVDPSQVAHQVSVVVELVDVVEEIPAHLGGGFADFRHEGLFLPLAYKGLVTNRRQRPDEA